MLKEFGIILLVVGCIFLLIPLAWILHLIPNGGQFVLLLWFIPLGFALASAISHARKLLRNHEVGKAATFVFILIIAVVLCLIATFSMGPYFTPRAHQ